MLRKSVVSEGTQGKEPSWSVRRNTEGLVRVGFDSSRADRKPSRPTDNKWERFNQTVEVVWELNELFQQVAKQQRSDYRASCCSAPSPAITKSRIGDRTRGLDSPSGKKGWSFNVLLSGWCIFVMTHIDVKFLFAIGRDTGIWAWRPCHKVFFGSDELSFIQHNICLALIASILQMSSWLVSLECFEKGLLSCAPDLESEWRWNWYISNIS